MLNVPSSSGSTSLGLNTPHIPSPSLEGYAKAANYMPAKRAEEIKRASRDQLQLQQQQQQKQKQKDRQAGQITSDVPATSSRPALPTWLLLALAVPAVLVARALLQKALV